MDNYKTLEKVFRKLNDISTAQSVLHWDAATVMPKGGAEARADQLATLSSLHHAILTDESLGELFDSAGKKGRKLNEWQKTNLLEMKRAYKHASAVPNKMIKDLSKAGSKCEMVWR